MGQITIQSFTLPAENLADGTYTLRSWYNQGFLTNNGQAVAPGTSTTGTQLRSVVTVSGGFIRFSPFNVYSTLDAEVPNPRSIQISCQLFKGNTGLPIYPFQQTGTPASWIVPDDLGSTISFEEWTIANQAQQLYYWQPNWYTAAQVDALIRANNTQVAFNQDYVITAYASLAAAVTAAAITDGTLVINESTACPDDLTVPENVTLRFTRKGSIVMTSLKTLTVLGPIEADPVKIFYNALATQGTIDFTGNSSLANIYPSWWGMTEANSASGNAASIAAADVAAQTSGGGTRIQVGTFPTNSVTFSAPVAFDPGESRLRPANGQTVTIGDAITADLSQHFDNALSGQGSIAFTNANGTVESSPIWWGGDPLGVTDSAPAINAAIASGARNINMRGFWGLYTPILITQPYVVFDGGSPIGAAIVPLKVDISTGALPNALIVNQTDATNLTIRNLRLNNGGLVYTGWGISAVEGGPGSQQSIVSLYLRDFWADLGSQSSGVFTGGVTDVFCDTATFENNQVRFDILVYNSAFTLSNIIDFRNFGPLIRTTSVIGGDIIVSNIQANSERDGFLFDLTDQDRFEASNVIYSDFDSQSVPGRVGGLLNAANCTNVIIDGFAINPAIAGELKGIFIDGSQVKLTNGNIENASTTVNFYPVYLTGAGNDVVLDNVSIKGARRQVVTENAGGRLTLNDCVLEQSVGESIISLGTETIDVTVQDSQVIDGSYGPSGVATNLITFSTSGRFVFQNNPAVGRTDTVNSASTYLFNFGGSGQLVVGGNNIVNVGSTGEYNPGGAQTRTFIANNVGGTSNRSQAGTPVSTVTPLFIGEEFLNTTGNHWFKAHGLTNTDWTALN